MRKIALRLDNEAGTKPVLHSEQLCLIFMRLRPHLLRFAESRLGYGSEDAEDAVSEAFTALWCRDSYAARPDAALFDLVRRNSWRRLKQLRRLRGKPDFDAIETKFASPEAEAIAADILSAVTIAISGLPPAQRECCQAVLLQDLSLLEASKAIGKPPKTIANRVSEGKATLRDRFRTYVDG